MESDQAVELLWGRAAKRGRGRSLGGRQVNERRILVAPSGVRSHTFRRCFVEHLSVKHGLTDREIPGMVLVDHNQVRYVGD
jgi:hypothetical protein